MLDPVLLAAQLRRVLYRPVVRRTVVAVVAVATTATVAAMLGAADAARSQWGDTRPVVVADRDLATGDVVDTAAVAVRDLPAALVTDAALDEVPDGATVRYPVAAGEPLVPDRLAPQGARGTAALVPAGHRAVTVPPGPVAAPPTQPGDLVDVLVVVAPGTGTSPAPGPESDGDPDSTAVAGTGQDADTGPSDPAFPLITGARVVDVEEDGVTLAVPSADAPPLAYAVAAGMAVLSLTGR